MDVSLLRWPEEEWLREELAERRQPRLLLVEAGAQPPSCLSSEEDWIRLPAPQADIDSRVSSLRLRHTVPGGLSTDRPTQPTLDADGLLKYGAQWVALAPVDARLAKVLLGAAGSVVSRVELQQAGWPDGEANENTLDVRIGRLRKRLATVGLTVRTVRSRGYVLTPARS